MSNPLYLGYKGSSLRYEKNFNLKTSKLWILCLKDGATCNPAIYEIDAEFSEYSDTLSILPMPYVMLSNPIIRGGLIRVDTLLSYFGIEDTENIVFLMADMSESQVKVLIDTIKPVTINDLIVFKETQKYHLNKDLKQFLSLARSSFDISYWQKQENCIIPTSLNKKFYALLDGVGDAYARLRATFKRQKIEFRDHSKAYNDYDKPDKEFKYYPERSHEAMRSDMVRLMTERVTPIERYNLICYLLMSKRYCHFVFDEHILPHLPDKPNITYLMTYAWATICRDQASRKADYGSRIWFDVSVACKLPTNTTWQYAVPLVKGKFLKPVNRSGCTMSICDQETITHRLKLFVGESLDLDWSKVAITGSAMAAIIPHKSPLMYNFGMNHQVTDEILKHYFYTYYKDSDVDVICEYDTLFEFIDSVITTSKKLGATIATIKTVSIHISYDRLRAMCNTGEIPYTTDYVLENRHSTEIRECFHKQYVQAKTANNEYNAQLIKNEHPYQTLLEYGTVDDIFINIVKVLPEMSDGRNNGLKLNHDMGEYQIRELHRFKLSKPGIRDIEMFNTKSIKGTVSNFHLPCVRAYYKPEATTMTALAITSYLTGWCLMMNYYSSSRTPFEIISKYHRRGFGIQLSTKEYRIMKTYSEYTGIAYPTMELYHYDEYYYGKYMGIPSSQDAPSDRFNPFTEEGDLKPLTLDIMFK